MSSRIRKLFVRTTFAEPVDLIGKTIIVTGAGPHSLGFATAKTLAEWGATVIITRRSETDAMVERLRDTLSDSSARARVSGQELDLSDRESVERFTRWFMESGEHLDVLVNNAGVHLDLLSRWKDPRLTDGYETHWRINYLGTAHLTHRLLPLLQRTGEATGDARIVTVGSQIYAKGSNEDMLGTTRPYNSWNAYGNSKLALMHMTSEIQRRHAATSRVQAYCLHPGSVFTRVADKGLEGTGLVETVRSALSPVEAFFLKTPDEGAQTQIHCATRAGLEGNIYFTECKPTPTTADATDAEIAKRLWAATEKWVAER